MMTDHPDGLLIDVRVQPKSSRNAVAGLHDDALKIRLSAPPVEGKANRALIQLIAKLLRCPKSAVTIASGPASRKKRLLVRIAKDAQFESRREALKLILKGLC
ncbi:MAG: DUF167 domain-containing protein [Desulfobacterales bacterium]|jgi:uncharacterized protein (TIGR00251 family)